MLYKNVCIEAYGYELPECIVSSEDIEKRLAPVYERLKLPFGRLELFSGIKERRFWENNVRPSEVGIISAKKAIQKSGISRKDIGCLINASVCKDFLEPATATVIHGSLELPKDSTVFDVSNACLGFVNGMIVLANMIELGQVKAGIVVSAETGKHLVNSTIEELLARRGLSRKEIKYYFASLTIGSGAVAVVMSHSSISKSGHRLIGGQVRANTKLNNLCVGGVGADVAYEGSVTMRTNAEVLLNQGVDLARETWKNLKKEFEWGNESVDRFFCHQIGSAYQKALFKALKLNEEKDFSTLEYLGNTGSAALPITMAIGVENGILSRGDKVAMLGIGSGLNCTMLGVEW